MQSKTITPVLMAGGSGTRLWPLSRKSYPKQFSALVGDETLFQTSVNRVTGADFNAPIVLTNSDFRFIVTEQLSDAGITKADILIEPSARNTAAAVLAAAMHIAADDPDTVMLVSPSDHVIPDTAAFHAAIQAGIGAACDGTLITFAITPTHAETGYGYLELEDIAPKGPTKLRRFVEKPDAARAAEMLDSGNFFWNAGIFLFTAATIIKAFEAHAPEMCGPVAEAVASATPDLGFIRLAASPWETLDDISIDYAVMERASNLAAVPFDAGWTDLGGWPSVWRESNPDAQGVVTTGAATAIDCHNSLLRSEADGQELVGIGLENIVAVAMPDAVLVADLDRGQDVKLAVDALKAKGAKQATAFPKDHRPWGWFETLVLGERFQVKRIVVNPGAALSLQSHVHRAEHWIVVSGTAKVTIEKHEQLVSENMSVYIPLGAKHRMENPGKVPMELIEVQTGSYLGEDDIVRYEDVYARPERPES
ncbi:mannose-1-phosphate guanylyltransferase/mannose-6-phosphate isomerase [Nereida sp. MMG025]|uniref:mannose-1-phosphate guanylyltransferase/mannose-6-phosphate isomerase n=1 Tax=Nereida sp. MMG025 TaxID=2909981 RepID=UPI001F02C3F7|nr:mannose-1-phosphate guanylyltransferase/mannose-6-phosphate isomerase [Nereida sp. MMG025]MCF6445813.1 mannose-1-phosphate guanylyltransferase/mannose-6-phosphate isomerase [Nereida sp. MMG025]